MNEDLTGQAAAQNFSGAGPAFYPETDRTKSDWTNQFYGTYMVGKLRLDSEYRRFVNGANYSILATVLATNLTDVRGWYVSGAYRVAKRLALGSYYSRYSITSVTEGPAAFLYPNQTDTSLPADHIYDKVLTGRVDLNQFWNVKVEGHFMNGYGSSTYPDGFYPQVNPQGFKSNTNALVLKTSLNF